MGQVFNADTAGGGDDGVDLGVRTQCRSRRRSSKTQRRKLAAAYASTPSNGCLGLSEILDKGLTRVVDAVFETMRCGLDTTCYGWMNSSPGCMSSVYTPRDGGDEYSL
mmetsp:Transcript_9009/g.21948  ORF Transcript_9009/g.21948 Transcript_9009/m.21948 type:complete len:108 (+) Transcript_9009:406-729(+)